MSIREHIESVQELVLNQESSQPAQIDQCVRSQEKLTKITSHQISVFRTQHWKLWFFSTKNSTINNSVSFQSFSDKILQLLTNYSALFHANFV